MGDGSSNPVVAVLTAPLRWARLLLARDDPKGWRRRPPGVGVREPRRPKPTLPAAAIALADPRADRCMRIRLRNLRDTDAG
jgi:hypothetical protein